MNIFVLDENPVAIPSMMLDKHVVKMVLESAQMFCTAHRVLDNVDSIRNIPSTKRPTSTIHALFGYEKTFTTTAGYIATSWPSAMSTPTDTKNTFL
jgi:hypothetical protein